jgi:glycerol-3-phosphate dehydrogenase (NAD(P)+)
LTIIPWSDTLTETKREKVGVIGGGSFGSAIADIIGTRGHDVRLWFRRKEAAEDFNRTRINAKYLPGIRLSESIQGTASLEEAVVDSNVVFICVPSTTFRDVARQASEFIQPSQMLISTTKGIEEGSFKLMTEVLREETSCLQVGALSGPNLAKEIVAKMPSGTVIASRFDRVNRKVQDLLSGPYFRVYSNQDVHGVELAGVLKNVYAIATGLTAALKLGDNTRGMLITRGLAEMSRMAACMGCNPMTFLGLAGVGDLVTTCSSPLSRNYRVGWLLGQGMDLEKAIQEIGEVAEGVNTIRIVKPKLPELGIHMHILEGLHQLLFEGMTLPKVLEGLMAVPQMEDVEFASSANKEER